MITGRIIFLGAVLAIVFFLIAFNPIKNTISTTSTNQYVVSVPVNYDTNVTLTNQQQVAALFSGNKTESIQNSLQQNVLTSVVQTPSDETSINVTVEKFDSIGTIKDRDSSVPNIFSFLTDQKTLPDLSGGKLRLSFDFQSKETNIPVKLNGFIKIKINDLEYASKAFNIDTNSGVLKAVTIPIEGNTYLEIPLDPTQLYLNVGINKLTVTFASIVGNMDLKQISKNDVLIYESEIQYSSDLKIYLDDENVTKLLYPSGDSTITFTASTSKFILSVASEERCIPYRNAGYYQPCFYYPTETITPAPIVNGVTVRELSTGKTLLDIPSLTGSQTVSLQRNSEYEINIQDPVLSWKIKTPSDNVAKYTYTCVTTAPSGYTVASYTTTCGHN